MKRFKDIDYDFRPRSYCEDADELAALLRNVKGTNRRQMIRDYWEAGRIDELSEGLLSDSLTSENAEPGLLEQLGSIHPTFMGGEYLPDYRRNEVEIARIELQSTLGDVISVRARPKGQRIAYSIWDEYDGEFEVSPASSKKPLTLGQVISMIDDAGQQSLAVDFTLMNYPLGNYSLDQLPQVTAFTTVESLFYPKLPIHYQHFTRSLYSGLHGETLQ